MMRKLMLMLLVTTLPASAHDCELPPVQYDHVPTVAYTLDPPVIWWHLPKACGYQDQAPRVPVLYPNGGAELFDLNRPNACRYKDREGVWHVQLPYGGGWTNSEIDRCKRFEYGSINGWKHRDPTE